MIGGQIIGYATILTGMLMGGDRVNVIEPPGSLSIGAYMGILAAAYFISIIGYFYLSLVLLNYAKRAPLNLKRRSVFKNPHPNTYDY